MHLGIGATSPTMYTYMCHSLVVHCPSLQSPARIITLRRGSFQRSANAIKVRTTKRKVYVGLWRAKWPERQAEKVRRSVNGLSAKSRKFVLPQNLLLAYSFFWTRWNTARKKIQFPRVKRNCNRESADILSDVPRVKLCVLGESIMSACHAVCRSNCFTIDQRDSKSERWSSVGFYSAWHREIARGIGEVAIASPSPQA